MKKAEFKDIAFDPDVIGWGVGNTVIRLNCIARIKLRKLTEAEEAIEKEKYDAAKKIYDDHINVGSIFRPIGENANSQITARITSINSEKSYITWKQNNLSEKDKSLGFKPAAGKWSISTTIMLVKNNEIKFIKPCVTK